ncbi:MAG: tRNA pseudouridine(55) synthase, partial [Bilifractor sp.]|nr:tRNA pseudouridine(55) synthase [Bilifractor sp.]
LKVNGRKLYEIAREGKTVERKARPVHFYEIRLLSCNLPRAVIRVTCSKGTYIRTLCHDIGERLGCGGCMEALTRVRVGQFHIEDSLRLSEVARLTGEGRWKDFLIPVYRLFDYPLIRTSGEADRLAHNGNRIPEEGYRVIQDRDGDPEAGFHVGRSAGQSAEEKRRVRLFDSEGIFVGIYESATSGGLLKPVRMFYDPDDECRVKI